MTSSTWLAALYWATLFAALWLLLAGNSGWYLGLPSVIAAAALAVRLQLAPLPIRPLALPRFVIGFLWAAIAGGWDVARRALHPRRPIAPGWVDYPVRSRHRQVRLLLSSLVGLLPGTLATGMQSDLLRLHVLDRHSDWQRSVEALERSLCRLFGEDLP
ncbi:Na+/H+ antiporter subunit E [Halopseudomonas nanhaiensis]|uniref:Na+/H+ antiporter subunit E n=1 Tax=Halopseudomonas nanhaiensis TaxID=2830842 RepID=UPI001CC09DBA|nr:Na+/H+ antiporter subunit E [Halopseudomonas nanhaiensis]UAW98698.1 Na+/H+ antiporter subunit E [Halopseudomonas nanhaiensis]